MHNNSSQIGFYILYPVPILSNISTLDLLVQVTEEITAITSKAV